MLPMLCSVSLISPNFDVKSIIFPNFGQGPFPEIAGKSPDRPGVFAASLPQTWLAKVRPNPRTLCYCFTIFSGFGGFRGRGRGGFGRRGF